MRRRDLAVAGPAWLAMAQDATAQVPGGGGRPALSDLAARRGTAAVPGGCVAMRADEIPATVTDIVIKQLGAVPASVTPGARFVEDLGADSLDQVEMVMAVEERFRLEIAEEDAARLKTSNDVVAYLTARLCPR